MKARSDVIKDLEVIKALIEWEQPIDFQESLDYAILSLKTDKAYQIMYEGGEIYTKADMEAMLYKIRAEIEEYRDNMQWERKSLVKWEAINFILDQIIGKYQAEVRIRDENNN